MYKLTELNLFSKYLLDYNQVTQIKVKSWRKFNPEKMI